MLTEIKPTEQVEVLVLHLETTLQEVAEAIKHIEALLLEQAITEGEPLQHHELRDHLLHLELLLIETLVVEQEQTVLHEALLQGVAVTEALEVHQEEVLAAPEAALQEAQAVLEVAHQEVALDLQAEVDLLLEAVAEDNNLVQI